MESHGPRSECPINFGVELVGDRWTLLIIRDMVLSGKTSYGEFLTSEEGIATNILANRLHSLEAEGLISKRPDPIHGKKFIYNLTEKGLDLVPLIVEIALWSAKHHEIPDERKDFVHLAQTKRDELIAGLQQGIREANERLRQESI
jgi:DNA-binding HxlR family transcriptional regulator